MAAVAGGHEIPGAGKYLLGTLLCLLSACGRTSSPQKAGPDDRGGAGPGGASSMAAAAGAPGAEPGNPFLNQALQGSPIYTRVERLTNSQFEHAAIDILGLPATTDLKSGLVSPVVGITTFTNNELVRVDDASALELGRSRSAAAAPRLD